MMNEPERRIRLDGLEADNLLAFLALLGVLRALQAARPEWKPRAAWDLDNPPLRPVLFLARPEMREGVGHAAAEGVAALAKSYLFDDRPKPDYTKAEARQLLETSVAMRISGNPVPEEILSSLISDITLKRDKDETDPTPLCLLGVAKTAYLQALRKIAAREAQRKKTAVQCIEDTLFADWKREDSDSATLRWDPAEDRRHALRWREPTSDAGSAEHGANRLAIAGLLAMTCAPVAVGRRIELNTLGGVRHHDDFRLAWPIWSDPATLSAIRAMLSHPKLHEGPEPLAHLSVTQVLQTRKVSNGRYRNFTRAEPILIRRASLGGSDSRFAA